MTINIRLLGGKKVEGACSVVNDDGSMISISTIAQPPEIVVFLPAPVIGSHAPAGHWPADEAGLRSALKFLDDARLSSNLIRWSENLNNIRKDR